MKLKDLFSVPDDQRVSEKQMLQVLICTACSILVCMSCMVGSAWAWFAVSVESSGNAIVVGKFEPAVSVTEGGTEVAATDGKYALEADKPYTVTVNGDGQELAGYVTAQLTDGTDVKNLVTHRVPYTPEGQNAAVDTQLEFTITVDKACEMTMGIGWGIPAEPNAKDGDAITVTFLTVNASESQEEESQEQTQEEEPEESTETQPSEGE